MVDPFDPKKHIALNTLNAHLAQGNTNNTGTLPADGLSMRTEEICSESNDCGMLRTHQQQDYGSMRGKNGDTAKDAAAGAPSIDTVQVMEGGQPSPTASSDSDDAFTVLHDNNSPVIVTRPVVPNSTAVQDSNGNQQQHQNIGDPVTDRIRIQAKDYENYLFHNSLNIWYGSFKVV